MLFVGYIILIIALVFMFGARFCSLVARREFRKDTVSYPTKCSHWALNDGCTRVAPSSTNCYNYGSIPDDYIITFDADAQVLNQAIQHCVEHQFVAKFQSPKDGISTSTLYQDFVHVTWSTGLLGVIDDMFLKTYQDSITGYSTIEMMSQLRIGRSDFNVNYYHVTTMLKCLNK